MKPPKNGTYTKRSSALSAKVVEPAAGSANRRALPIAGDDSDAKQAVVELLDEFGFDAVDAGSLAEGWRFQRDTAAYGAVLDADGMRDALGRARRYADM